VIEGLLRLRSRVRHTDCCCCHEKASTTSD
jgi:hypothetical protein